MKTIQCALHSMHCDSILPSAGTTTAGLKALYWGIKHSVHTLMIADPVYFCGTGKDCVKLCQAIFILKDKNVSHSK